MVSTNRTYKIFHLAWAQTSQTKWWWNVTLTLQLCCRGGGTNTSFIFIYLIKWTSPITFHSRKISYVKFRTCHFQWIFCVQCLCSTVYCRIAITNKDQSNLAPQHCHLLQLHSGLKTQNACHYGKLHAHKCAVKMTVFGTEWIAELLHLHMESVCTVFIRSTVFTRCIVFTRCTVVTGACFYRASVFLQGA